MWLVIFGLIALLDGAFLNFTDNFHHFDDLAGYGLPALGLTFLAVAALGARFGPH